MLWGHRPSMDKGTPSSAHLHAHENVHKSEVSLRFSFSAHRPLPSAAPGKNDMLEYCKSMKLSPLSPNRLMLLSHLQPLKPLHSFQPGDWVVIKELRRKQWTGPFHVLLTTHSCEGCRRVLEPADDPAASPDCESRNKTAAETARLTEQPLASALIQHST